MNNYVEEEILAEPRDDKWALLTYSVSLLEAYAWYIVAFVGFLYYIWKQKLESKYEKWREAKEIAKECEEMKKNPDLYINREQARMIAVQKLQEEYNRQAYEKKELEKEKDEKRREELKEKLKSEGGRKLNDDYLPLAGNSSLGCRPTRRTGCPGGSCNNR